jgi:hypothetical protein
VLASLYSARILGLLGEDEYRRRVRRSLQTLERLPLFENVAFNRMYGARTARMVNRAGRVSDRGYGWSATDLGRLLLWLNILAKSDSTFAESATRAACRLRFDRIVSDGYLRGEDITASGRRRQFQEGRIGYEQYAARGFAAWGAEVPNALDLRKNATPVTVRGHELLRDTRGLDRISSEPFVLLGLETGWTAAEDTLARSVLAVQERRFRETGIVTIVSEDAIGIPPHYFYYYCVYCSGRSFVIETSDPGKPLNSPRWVSTKATFAWQALLPSEYTEKALSRVARARTSRGWSSGVFERSGKSTETYDLNTVAIILEAAAYRKLGRPLAEANAIAPER